MYPTRPVNWSQSFLSSLCIPNPMINAVKPPTYSVMMKHTLWYYDIPNVKVPHHPPDFYTCPFRTGKLDKWESLWRVKISTWKTSFDMGNINMKNIDVLCLCWGWNMKSSRFKMLDPTLVQIPDRCYCAHFPAKRFKSKMSKSIQLFSNPDKFSHLFLRGFSEATTLTRFSLGHKEAGAPFQC